MTPGHTARKGFLGVVRTLLLLGVTAAVSIPVAAAYNIRDYRAPPETVPQARPGQPGFIAPTLMHLDPCGDRVEGLSWDDLEDYWEEIEDRAEEAYEDAIDDDKLSPDEALQVIDNAVQHNLEVGGPPADPESLETKNADIE